MQQPISNKIKNDIMIKNRNFLVKDYCSAVLKKEFILLSICCFFITTPLYAQFTCGDTLVDIRDGKKYSTVLIGSQCWMGANLNIGVQTTSINTGSPHADVSDNGIIEKYCFDNDSLYCIVYGGLYDWNELMDYDTATSRGICPQDWHIPSFDEWRDLTIQANYDSRNLKAIGEGHGDGAGTNALGFSALHGGDRGSLGVFTGDTLRSIFWTSTVDSTNASLAHHTTLRAVDSLIYEFSTQKLTGFSCRCIKDENSTSINEQLGSKLKITLWPNPTNDLLFIRLTTKLKNANVQIYDILGNCYRSFEMELNSPINVKSLPNGAYFLKITIHDAYSIQKFMKFE